MPCLRDRCNWQPSLPSEPRRRIHDFLNDFARFSTGLRTSVSVELRYNNVEVALSVSNAIASTKEFGTGDSLRREDCDHVCEDNGCLSNSTANESPLRSNTNVYLAGRPCEEFRHIETDGSLLQKLWLPQNVQCLPKSGTIFRARIREDLSKHLKFLYIPGHPRVALNVHLRMARQNA